MKVINLNCGWRREYESDLRSNEHYLSGSEYRAWKNSGLYGIWPPDRTGLNFFSGPIFTTAQVVFIIAKIAFIFTYFKYHWKGCN